MCSTLKCPVSEWGRRIAASSIGLNRSARDTFGVSRLIISIVAMPAIASRIKIHSILLLMIFLFFSAGLALAEETTVVGEVIDNYEIVADGQIYAIADTEKGRELVDHYISARVRVTGTVEEVDDMKILTVISYEILSD